MESVGDLFKGRHFDWEIIVLCVLASPIQAQPSGSRGNDGRARIISGPHDNHRPVK